MERLKVFFLPVILANGVVANFWSKELMDKEIDTIHTPKHIRCLTVSGPTVGAPCLFPFTFEGVTYEGCITLYDPEDKPWCSTKINRAGVHIGGFNHWGHCHLKHCPMHSEVNGEEDQKNEDEEYEHCRTSYGENGKCKPASLCPGVSDHDANLEACQLQSDNPEDLGICCVDVQSNKWILEPILETSDQQFKEVTAPKDVSVEDVEEAVTETFSAVNHAPRFKSAGHVESAHSKLEHGNEGPEDLHYLFNKPTKETLSLDRTAQRILRVSKILKFRKGLSDDDADAALSFFNADTSKALRRNCPWVPFPKCDPGEKYRSFDGSCNNLKLPIMGQNNTPFQRILRPEYSQGPISLPRRAQDGSALPSARLISTQLISEPMLLDQEHTIWVMQMGQFIDHDLTNTPTSFKKCCPEDNSFPETFDAQSCFPIQIPPDDPFWKNRRGCIALRRSLLSPALSCGLEMRQQTNQISHWLDGSNIYGSHESTARFLRRNTGGLLKVSDPLERKTRPIGLPICFSRNITECNCPASDNNVCFIGGDGRLNEQMGLIMMHTIWMREHNKIAGLLKWMHLTWSDEKLFQEARRITIAEYQHVIYNEWLPIVLGKEFMKKFDLLPQTTGYSKKYGGNIDARILNEFAAAAFRFGHSLIPKSFERKQRGIFGGLTTTKLHIQDLFFEGNLLVSEPSFFGDMVRGFSSQNGEVMDGKFVNDVTDHLFETKPGKGGLDLFAINVQRGRDHGLPGYNSYREVCRTGSGRANDWSDFEDVIPKHLVNKLKQVYTHIDDVDLFTGGLLERHDDDSLLGPTFKCIVGDQFIRLKFGDRFFYDLGLDSNLRFTARQLKEIRKVSMARIFCDNVDGISAIQPQVFKAPSSSDFNRITSCHSIKIPSVNYWVFKENSIFGKR